MSLFFDDTPIKSPKKPVLFGNRFEIRLQTSRESSSKTNAIHNISIYGLRSIYASDDIASFLYFHFQKMTKHFLAETIEKLASDYNCQSMDSVSEYYYLDFSLDRNQTMEFLDLVERASQGVSI